MSRLEFRKAVEEEAKGNVAWGTITVGCALMKSTWTPAMDTDQYLAALVSGGHEVSGGGYARKTSATSLSTAAAGIVRKKVTSVFNFGFLAAGLAWRHVVLYVHTGSDATALLLAVESNTGDWTATGGEVTVTVDATNGIVTVTAGSA